MYWINLYCISGVPLFDELLYNIEPDLKQNCRQTAERKPYSRGGLTQLKKIKIQCHNAKTMAEAD